MSPRGRELGGRLGHWPSPILPWPVAKSPPRLPPPWWHTPSHLWIEVSKDVICICVIDHSALVSLTKVTIKCDLESIIYKSFGTLVLLPQTPFVPSAKINSVSPWAEGYCCHGKNGSRVILPVNQIY